MMDAFKLSQIWIALLQKLVPSVKNNYEVIECVHFSPHDKVHFDVFEDLVLIGDRHLLLALYKLTFEPHP